MVSGEGQISSGDIASAKLEAISRAKWAAIEQVAGVDIKSKTVVENSALLDEIIISQTQGIISSFNVLGYSKAGQILHVKLEACVKVKSAQTAISDMTLNSAITIYVPYINTDENSISKENIVSNSVTTQVCS